MKPVKNIIFDYDGTLHDSIRIYAPAFKVAYTYLVKNGYTKKKIWSDDEISQWLGYSSKDMWDAFMPHLPEYEKEKCSRLIGTYMLKYLNQNHAQLYPGSIEVLHFLKAQGFNLIFLSNCKIEYMLTHKRLFNLDQYFCDFYCTEAFNFLPKYEIFNTIKEKYDGDFIVVGDRFVDMELAKHHNLYSIGCQYGYGNHEELKGAHVLVQNVLQIKDILSFFLE